MTGELPPFRSHESPGATPGANQGLKETFIHGVIWSGAGKVLSSLCSFALTFILARALTPAGYGQFTVALSTIVIVAGVGTLGMDQMVIRFVSMCAAVSDTSSLRRVILRCLDIVAAATAVVFVGFLLLAPGFYRSVLNMPRMADYTVLLGLWVLFATFQRQLQETFRGLNDIKRATLFGGIRSSGILNSLLACIAVACLWAVGGLTLFSALLVMLAASVVVVGFSAVSLRQRQLAPVAIQGTGATPSTLDLSISNFLQEGWLLWLATLLGTLGTAGMVWLASAVDTSAHVALFGVAQGLTALLVAPMIIFNAVLPPVIARLHASGEAHRLERVVRASAGILLLLSLFLFVLLLIFGRQLLGHVFGAYYETAYPILVLFCLAQVINIGAGAWEVILPMTGLRRETLTVVAVTVAAEALFGIALGLQFGVFGVATGFLVAAVASNVFGVWIVHRRLRIFTIATVDRQDWHEVIQLIRTKLQFYH